MAVALSRFIPTSYPVATASLTTNDSVAVAGEFVVLWVGCDNTAGSNLPSVSSVTFNGVSQTFSVRLSVPSASTTANAAVVGYAIVIPSLSVGGNANWVVTMSAAPAKAIIAGIVFTGVSDTVSVAAVSGTGNVARVAAAVPAGHLVLAMTVSENNALGSVDSDTTGGAWQASLVDFTTGGGAAANVSVQSGYKIPSGAGDQSWLAASGFANDGGSAIVALAPSVPRSTAAAPRARERGEPVRGLTLRPRRRRRAA